MEKILLVLVALLVSASSIIAQQPYGLAEVEYLVSHGVSPARILDKAKNHCLDFDAVADSVRLHRAGADDLLIGQLSMTCRKQTTSSISFGFVENLDEFPIYTNSLPLEEEARLGLHPVVLESSWEGLNWDGKRYKAEILHAGDTVLVDREGIVRYRKACGNRLQTLLQNLTSTAETDTDGVGDRLEKAAKAAWGAIGRTVGPPARATGWLLALLAIPALLLGGGYGIFRVIRRFIP